GRAAATAREHLRHVRRRAADEGLNGAVAPVAHPAVKIELGRDAARPIAKAHSLRQPFDAQPPRAAGSLNLVHAQYPSATPSLPGWEAPISTPLSRSIATACAPPQGRSR